MRPTCELAFDDTLSNKGFGRLLFSARVNCKGIFLN